MEDFVGAWFGIGIAVGFVIGALSVLVSQRVLSSCYSHNSSKDQGPTASSAIVLTTHGYDTSNPAPAATGHVGPLAGGQHRWKHVATGTAPAPDTLPMSDARPKALPAPVKPEHVAVSMPAAAPQQPRTGTVPTSVPPTAAALSVLAQQHDARAATTASNPYVPAAAQTTQPAAAPVAPAPAPAAAGHHHQRGVSSASVYDVDDLDSEWNTLLDNVDAMLVGSGRPAMLPQERPIAVRKLVAATGTRGVEFALGAAVAEVVKFRSWHAQPAHRGAQA